MAEVPLPTPTDNAVPSTDIRDAVYAGAMLDKVVTSTELTYTDRLGGEHYTVDGMKAEGDKIVEETRQNLIPLSRQYMTLEAAQADIANIPEGSTTYYRSPDDSALAVEVINNAGTLEPTGRKMPSQQSIDKYFQALPDGTFAIVADNGVILAIDSQSILRIIELSVSSMISMGGSSIGPDELSGFFVRGGNGIPFAVTEDGVARMVAMAVGRTLFSENELGVPWSVLGSNGYAAVIDESGALRVPAVITGDLRVAGKKITGSDSSGTVFASGDRYLDSSGKLMPLMPDNEKMSGWGSSSMVAYGGDANFAEMAAQLGVSDWNNQGQGGETSFQVAARFGSVPFTLNFPDGKIPASGTVSVSCTQLPSNYRNNYLKPYFGNVAGVRGRLFWTGGSTNSLQFTRSVAGSEVLLSGASDFIPELPPSYIDGVVVLWMYKNDMFYSSANNPEINMDLIFSNVVKTFAHVSTLVKRCLVVGVFNDSSYSNNEVKDRLAEMNARMKAQFGDLYCDTQDYMCSSQIWIDAGITPTTSDLTMQSQGLKATSLSADNAHLNTAAHKAIVQNCIKKQMINLGWYSQEAK